MSKEVKVALIGGAFVLLAALLADWRARVHLSQIELPARVEESLLNFREAEKRLWDLQMAPIEHETFKKDLELKEHQVNQTFRPAVQVRPRIVQSGAVEDIREIELWLLLSNIGNADATIKGVQVYVEDGHPKGKAGEILAATQDYYYSRERDYHHPRNLWLNQTSPVQQATHEDSLFDVPAPKTFGEPTPADPPDLFGEPEPEDDGGGLFGPEPKLVDKRKDDFLFGEEPDTNGGEPLSLDVLHQNHVSTRDVYNPQTGRYDQQRAEYPCPHGRIFAIGEGSPSVEWIQITDATQSLSRQLVLRPTQEATHCFRFVLTEYPNQHHRQWIRFRIVVEQLDEVKQEYTMMVSGLPLPPCGGMTSDCVPCSMKQPCVVEPEAPLIPIELAPAR